ncbi:MAG TPA: peptidoglycan-binding protein [Pyrinomonadaceae bacterium]|nr:peptidoglycan-binding protein [Pyrinomonadaceae bacterium]
MKNTRRFFSLLALTALALTLCAALPAGSGAAADDSEPAQRPLNWAVTGPMGGDVRSLVIDPQDAQRLYLGTIDGQIYTSGDGGATWARVEGFNRAGLYIDNLIVDPRNQQTLYAAAHRHKEPGGFFKTTDGGRTWREAAHLKTQAVHALGQSPTNPDVLVAGTNNGVWRSGDAGETWEQLATTGMTNINVESLAIDPRSDDVIYAGTWHLPFKTTDGGRTWAAIKNGIIDDSDVFAIEIDERNPDHVIASACSGIYETRNAGANWRKVNGIPSQSRRTRAIVQHPSLPKVIYAGTTEGFWMSADGGADWRVTTSRQVFEVNAIAVHPKNPNTVFIGTNNYGVMISRDGGRTWVPSNEGYSGRRAYAVLQDRERPNRVYATTINTATGGGYFYTSDDGGQTWALSTRNMPNRLIAYSILQDERDANVIYLGTNLGLYRSTDRGVSWAPVTAPKPKPAPRASRRGRGGARPSSASQGQPAAPPAPVRADDNVRRAQEALNVAGYDVGTPDGVAGTRTVAALRKFQTDRRLPVSGKLDDTTLAALGLAGGMQTSAAGVQALQSAPVFLTETINALEPTHDERNGRRGMFAATNGGLYRTYDPDGGWERIAYSGGLDQRTLCVSASVSNPQTIFAGTSTTGVLVSRDGGETWQQVTGVPAIAPINVIVQDPQRPTHVYVGTTQTFYISHDGGQRWLRRGGNLPLGSYTSVLINPDHPEEIFVGDAWEKGGGVFRSSDAGMTWRRVDPALPSRRVWSLAFDAQDKSRLFVGSHSAGVYIVSRDTAASASTDK